MTNSAQACPRCHEPIPVDAPGGICPGCALLAAANPTENPTGALANAPDLEEVAAAFPELEVLEIIGHGGMGVVFKARQPRLDRCVALKILPLHLAAQPGFSERFTREARALARLNHPNIVAVYDFGESGGFFHLTMEFVDGVNLRHAIRAGVTPEQALALVPRLCEALQFAHDKGVLHRDIKPENILLDTSGTVKLVDFGIAKFAGDPSAGPGLTASGSVLGTASYMAPEQIEKPGTVDHRADIYSLGVVFYEMLTGELPIGRFAAPSEKSTVTRGVDEVVFRALEKERDRRQQSATEMRTQVEGVGAWRPATAPPPPPHIWLQRLFWLGVCAIALPVLLIANDLGVRSGGGMGRLVWLLSVIAVVALVFGFRRTGSNAEAAPAAGRPNPWPHRLFWLVVSMLVLPMLTVFAGVVLPRLTMISNDLGARSGGWMTMLVWLLPALAVAALVFGFRRTLPKNEALAAGPWNPWPKRVFFLLIVVLGLPALLFGLGVALPIFARSQARPTQSADPAPRATVAWVVTSANPPFVARFPQGSIELVGIFEHPSTGSPGWRMDGSPAAEGPFVGSGRKTTADPSLQFARELVFRTRDLPPDASSLNFEVPGSSGWSSGPRPAAMDAPSKALDNYHLMEVTLPKAMEQPDPGKVVRELTVRAGVTYGSWRRLEATLGTSSFRTSVRYADVEWKISFGAAIETKDGRTILTSTHAEHPDWEVRIAALKKDGQEVAATPFSNIGEQSEWSFIRLPLEKVREFQFQVRPRHWVEFRGIALNPSAGR